MLNRFPKRGFFGVLRSQESISVSNPPIYNIKNVFSSSAASNEPTRQDTEKGIEPPRFKPMKRPIIKGRYSKDKKTTVLADMIENPFKGKGLPFGRRIFFQTQSEEDLAKGKNWNPVIDRFNQWIDFDLVERGWDCDYYRKPKWNRPYQDITNKPDVEYHFHYENLAIHIDMASYIPHLRPFMPELYQDFKNICEKNFTKVIEEVLSERKKPMKTTMAPRDKWGPNGLVKVNAEGNIETDSNAERKKALIKHIEMTTIKKFVDKRVEEKDYVKLIFIDAMGTKYFIYGVVGETLLQACRRYLIPIDGYCNGFDRGHIRVYGWGGFCHACQMDISPKFFHLIPPFDWNEKTAFLRFRSITPTSRLGCCIWIRPEFDGMVINIPITLIMPFGREQD